MAPGVARVFLLSPASSVGERASLLLARSTRSDLAVRLRGGGAAIGEVFAFVSSLYFRGKLTYARRFAAPPDGCPGVLVITSDRGLVPPETKVLRSDLRGFARVPIAAGERRYARPLRADAEALRAQLPARSEVVLLGSIASDKYSDVLLSVFGRSLLFPGDFVGRGDMSRGGLLLRAARAGAELDYRPLDGAERRGQAGAALAAERRKRD